MTIGQSMIEGNGLRLRILHLIEPRGFAVPLVCAQSQGRMASVLDIPNQWSFWMSMERIQEHLF